jgi:hypothetical protein
VKLEERSALDWRSQIASPGPIGQAASHASGQRQHRLVPCRAERPTRSRAWSDEGLSGLGDSAPPTTDLRHHVDQRARREVELASTRDCYDDPHRRSHSGGAHSSSRLAPLSPTPVVSAMNLTARVGVPRPKTAPERYVRSGSLVGCPAQRHHEARTPGWQERNLASRHRLHGRRRVDLGEGRRAATGGRPRAACGTRGRSTRR